MDLDPRRIYRELVDGARLALPDLPRTHGIYALFDHASEMRYVGITPGDRYGFHGRINGRHVAGSEGRSHKFSHAYNTGRMWRAKGDVGADAKVAKDLRTMFARRYCRATVVAVDRTRYGLLPRLEAEVQALSPPGQLSWLSRRSFDPYDEPSGLVDTLMSELGFSRERREAVARQRARWSGTAS